MNNAGDYHKAIVGRLLDSASELRHRRQTGDGDKTLVQMFGDAWSTKVALCHQLLTRDTKFVAVLEEIDPEFDILKDDLSKLNKSERRATINKIVKQVMSSDVKGSYVEKGLVERSFDEAQFCPSSYNSLHEELITRFNSGSLYLIKKNVVMEINALLMVLRLRHTTVYTVR